MIPIGSPHKKNAETLMNYYYEPEVAAEVAAWVNYITPVVGARGGGRRGIDPDARREPADLPQRGDALAGLRLPHADSGAEEQAYQHRVPGRPAGSLRRWRIGIVGREVGESGADLELDRDHASGSRDSRRSRTST